MQKHPSERKHVGILCQYLWDNGLESVVTVCLKLQAICCREQRSVTEDGSDKQVNCLAWSSHQYVLCLVVKPGIVFRNRSSSVLNKKKHSSQQIPLVSV